MTNYPQDIHTSGEQAPTVSNEVARCQVCGAQWQVRGESDKKGCPFCDAPADAISIENEEF